MSDNQAFISGWFAVQIAMLTDENAALRRDAHEWRQAAQNLGEVLTPVGPDDYYSFSPDQWLAWAKQCIGAIEKK